MAKSKLDKDIYSYENKKKQKLWAYRYRYYDTLGRRREKSKQGFKTEKDAYRHLLEVKQNIVNGDIRQVEHSNITVAEWLDSWYETNKDDWKYSTQKQRKRIIEKVIKPILGRYILPELDRATYRRIFINELLKKYKPRTVRHFHDIFKISINAAIENEILQRNRFNKITLTPDDSNVNFLSPSELNLFLEKAKAHTSITTYTLILLLAYSGFRKGEAHGLKWSDIDFIKSEITIERTRDNLGVRAPKTKSSYRTIMVDKAVISQLKTYLIWCKKTKLLNGLTHSDDDFIFIGKSGMPVCISSLNTSMNMFFNKYKLKPITVHGLRHTHATILISKHVPITTIAKRLGNSPLMIQTTYSHSFKELDEESVIIFGQALHS